MTLTSLHILDTGYLDVAKDSGQLPTAQRVNDGGVLMLKGVEFAPESQANLDKSPLLASYANKNVPVLTVSPDEFSIRIFINSNNTDTNNSWSINDMAYLTEIFRLPKTLGIKAIYYPVTTTAAGDLRKRDSQVVYQLGRADVGGNQSGINVSAWNGTAMQSGLNLTNVRYIPVRFERCRIIQVPGSQITIELNGVFCG